MQDQPFQRLQVTHPLTERCNGDKAPGCYQTGLALAKDGGTVAERTKGVHVISEACAAKITAACDTFTERLKEPQRLTGRDPTYTRRAARLRGKISYDCTVAENGVFSECTMVSPLSASQKELLAKSGIEDEFLDALETWRFTPWTFDGRLIEFSYVIRIPLEPG